MINFIRNVLPTQIIHLTTILSPLSSNIKPFLWEEKHSLAFDKIKEILKTNFSYTEGRMKNAINIIYTDASTSLMGGICFHYSTENIIADPPPDLTDNRNVFLNHLNHYEISCKTVPLITNDNAFESFVLLILKCIHIHEKKDLGKNDIDLFLNGLFSCITKIRGILGAGSEINMILHHIIFEKITDDYFFAHFQIILLMFGFIAKRNI